jgi:hypothetical protein
MLRASLITAFTLTTVTPMTAAAQDCMCFGPDTVARSLHVAQSQDLGPFFSSDGTLLSSRAVDEDAQREAPTEILWCWSANDPRCAPANPPQEPNPCALQTAHALAILDEAIDWPPPDSGSRPPYPDARDARRPGVRARVERPPRG